MKRYTTEEVISLQKEYDQYYFLNFVNNHSDEMLTFANWLKDKEQSIPVKDQIIWVKHKSVTSNWEQRHFYRFNEFGGVVTYTKNKSSENACGTTWWDKYSLTDPNETRNN